MMKKITTTLLTAALLAGCGRVADSELTVISNENTRTHSDRGLVPDMIEDWDFIRLETSEASLLHETDEIAIDDGLIFVYSRPNNVNVGSTPVSLKVFDMQGKYLRNIGIFGRAANNYLTISSWALDKANKRVAIVDYDKILKYDYDGNLLETLGKNEGLDNVLFLDYLPDGNILGHDYVTGRTDVQIRLMDGDFNTIDTLAMRGFKLNDQDSFSPMGVHWMNKHGDHVMVSKDFPDTIYTYAGGKLHPELFLELSRSMEGISLVDGINRSEAQARLRERGYREKKMTDIYETDDNYVLMNRDNTKTLIWDKADERGVMLGDSDPASQAPFGPIIYADGDWIVTCIEAYKILEYKEMCAGRGIETTPRMAALFDGLKETDNPVLIRYKLKTASDLF